MRKEGKDGFVLEINDEEEIISLASGLYFKVKIGQEVKSNGRIFFPAGTKGTVVKIREPYTHGRTSNVVEVLFNSHQVPCAMKPKDLIL